MPVNKSAKVRYDIIDECLRNTTIKWTKQRLLDHVNRRLALHNSSEVTISISQIRYDLQNMEIEFGAPIASKREGRIYYYYYEDEAFSINNIPISEQDIDTLNGAMLLLQQFHQFQVVKETKSVFDKLQAKVNYYSHADSNIMQFSYHMDQYVVETLEDLFQSILQKNTLRVQYGSGSIKTYHIRPYVLKSYHDNWYLLAFCKEDNQMEVFEINKLSNIAVVNTTIPVQEDLIQFFNDRIGVSERFPHQSKEQITLQLEGNAALEVISRPLHHSQRILKAGDDIDKLILTLDVIINKELIKKILSFGPEATVLGPDHLAQEVSTIIKDTMGVYLKKTGYKATIKQMSAGLYKKAV